MATSVRLLREIPDRSPQPQRRPIVIVVGMHRSGTSLCAHILSALGVDMADRLEAPGNSEISPDNAKGHWERWEIVEFHDRILRLLDREYYSPRHDFPFPVAWWADPRVAQVRRDLKVFLENRMGPGPFGFKDPRTVRLLPMWHQVARELGLAPKFVFCLRNPAEVAGSLHARDKIGIETAEYRWFAYNIEFFRYVKQADYCTIDYPTWFEDPSKNLDKLQAFLDLPLPATSPDVEAILEIVDTELRHHNVRPEEARQPLVRSLYQLARRAESEPAARDDIYRIGLQFQAFLQLRRAHEQEFERASNLIATIPPLEQELAALRESLARSDRQFAAADHDAKHNKERAEELKSELAQQKSDAAQLREAAASWERDGEAQARLVIDLRAEIGGLQAALTRSEQDLREHAAAAAGALAEIADMRQALDAATREATQQEAITAAQQEALREAFVHTERSAQEHLRHTEGLEQEIRVLRDTHAKSTQESLLNAAELAAIKSEVAELNGALANVREIALAAIRALAAGEVAVPPARRLTWRRSIRLWLGLAGWIRPRRGQ